MVKRAEKSQSINKTDRRIRILHGPLIFIVCGTTQSRIVMWRSVLSRKDAYPKQLLHNLITSLGLDTKYVFLHVGWVQNLNLFLVVLSPYLLIDFFDHSSK
jgi:hypothetical protein